MDGHRWEGRGERMGEKGTGKNKHNWQAQNIQGDVKKSIGNGEAKELLCTTHGHELRGGTLEGEVCRVEGDKGDKKKWDNGNSIINKIQLKNKTKF